VAITEKDNGYRELLRSLDKFGSYEITVGVHSEEGSATEEGGTTLIEVAERNEFGLGVPARPFLGPWADERRDDAVRQMRDASAEALKARKSPAARLDQLAQKFAGEVQARIAGGVPPPNAPTTVERKGSSTPLVDTGTLRGSIRGKVGPGQK
jgi:hypothetical protein